MEEIEAVPQTQIHRGISVKNVLCDVGRTLITCSKPTMTLKVGSAYSEACFSIRVGSLLVALGL